MNTTPASPDIAAALKRQKENCRIAVIGMTERELAESMQYDWTPAPPQDRNLCMKQKSDLL